MKPGHIGVRIRKTLLPRPRAAISRHKNRNQHHRGTIPRRKGSVLALFALLSGFQRSIGLCFDPGRTARDGQNRLSAPAFPQPLPPPAGRLAAPIGLPARKVPGDCSRTPNRPQPSTLPAGLGQEGLNKQQGWPTACSELIGMVCNADEKVLPANLCERADDRHGKCLEQPFYMTSEPAKQETPLPDSQRQGTTTAICSGWRRPGQIYS